jgi:hypothetical protein
MVSHGFESSFPGDSTPDSCLDARAPSVSFAPHILVSLVPSALLPAYGPSLAPAVCAATGGISRPPAKPPPPQPPTLLPSNTFPPLGPPYGSLLGMLLHDGLSRPSLIDTLENDTGTMTLLPNSLRGPPLFSSVNWVFTCPRVLGFRGDGRSYARINLTGMMTSESPGSFIDGGANICDTGNLDLLFDAVEITPLPISVTLQGDITQDDCCTLHRKIPLQLDDGSIYWQDCYTTVKTRSRQ